MPQDRPLRLGLATRGIQSTPTLRALLNEFELLDRPAAAVPLHAYLAWGRKPSAERARRAAERRGVPIWQVEDGFLRSVELGDRDPPLSIVLDDVGVYYDAGTPSRLEALVVAPHSAAQQDRARGLAALWRAGRLSKYNHTRDAPPPLPGPFVLAVDQTWGDASIAFGQAGPQSFAQMLEAALDEHPGATVLLKVHPDVIAGRKRGHFGRLTPGQTARVRLLGTDAHPAPLLEHAAAVYVVTSQIGFEGLLWGRSVRTFGMPFYAGWGLTADALPPPSRRRPVPLDTLVHAALIEYPRYLDPETQTRCEAETLFAWMALQRRMRQRFAPAVHALGFSRWKKPLVRAYFDGSEVRFVRRADRVPAGATLAIWGRRPLKGAPPADATTVRLEDGFLRSVGLGADLVRPLSWVMDRRGIYYDATSASDLEIILGEAVFDPGLTARAGALREAIVAAQLTKYNVGARRWQRPAQARRVILVPGQVETDESIRLGAPAIKTNIALLRAVRAANPDAWVVYKPHPDVVAGLRRQGLGELGAAQHCDEVVVDVHMGELLEDVDEVHVLTSLAGFEALLRGRKVVTYGQPFYAGWGLTQDHVASGRRGRMLSLDELVAGVLILYPTYVSRVTGRYTTPENALRELVQWRKQGPTRLPLWRRLWRQVAQLVTERR